MDAWAKLLEGEADEWRLLLEEAEQIGEFEMFVRIGDRVINLATVTMMEQREYDNRVVVQIDFVGGTCERVYQRETETFRALVEWMERQVAITIAE